MEQRLKVSLRFFIVFLSILIYSNHISGFNLDLNSYTVFSGPEDSYFGFSVDFYQSSSKSISVVVGAPRANTSQPGVSRGGSVFMCPWTSSGESCQTLNFDQKGDENITFIEMLLMAHKSNQWLGASVRTYKNYILACAPLFHWNVLTEKEEAMNTPVGNCQLLDMQTGKLANYAPCREFYVEGFYVKGCKMLVILGAPGGYYFQGKIASYFGHSVAVTDINRDGCDDILIGAPLFMEQLSTQKFREVGQVFVYLQRKGFSFSSRPNQILTGTYAFGRFGSAIAPLGDIDHDGFNDVAVGAPGSGEGGQVFIYLGQSDGLSNQYVQLIESPFKTLKDPPMFGFSMRGGTDIDDNGYPDLIIGAWGASKVATYRYLFKIIQITVRTLKFFIVIIWLYMLHNFQYIGLNQRFSTGFNSGPGFCTGHQVVTQHMLNTELQLDRMKQSMARRTLLLDSNQPSAYFHLSVERNSADVCKNFTAYLLPEFKDKLSPIFISVNYSLANSKDAVLHGQSVAVGQTRIILNCGQDNICIPDLRLKAVASTQPILIGDENPALLIIEAENQGEGAYETELYISPPAHTHYQGVVSNQENFTHLVCGQKKENGSVIVVCDLGNPMELKAGLYFSMGGLEQVEDHITFQMQIRSKNSQNPDSNLVQLQVDVNAVAFLEMRGLVLLPFSHIILFPPLQKKALKLKLKEVNDVLAKNTPISVNTRFYPNNSLLWWYCSTVLPFILIHTILILIMILNDYYNHNYWVLHITPRYCGISMVPCTKKS
uniref:Integrin, alpha 2b n=1 Tax=Cyprinus carpio TaxID=7962 RepID=A0A8C2CIK5_CYPCA